jgi:hypothetical protein
MPFQDRQPPLRIAPPPLPHQQPYTLDPDHHGRWYRNRWIWGVLALLAVVGAWVALAAARGGGDEPASACELVPATRADHEAGLLPGDELLRPASRILVAASVEGTAPGVSSAARELHDAAAQADGAAVDEAFSRLETECAAP